MTDITFSFIALPRPGSNRGAFSLKPISAPLLASERTGKPGHSVGTAEKSCPALMPFLFYCCLTDYLVGCTD